LLLITSLVCARCWQQVTWCGTTKWYYCIQKWRIKKDIGDLHLTRRCM